MHTKNILPEFWQELETKETKIAKKILDWLDYDKLTSIVVDGDRYWLENTCSYHSTPDYVFNYIKRWCKGRGLIYLFS